MENTEESVEYSPSPFDIIKNKQRLIEMIKEWVLYDTHIKAYNEKIKDFRDKKINITEEICEHMTRQTQLESLKNQNIKFSDGELKFYEKKEYSPLSFSYIEECLENILEDQSQIEFIMDYLRDNREVTTYIDIKRLFKNSNR